MHSFIYSLHNEFYLCFHVIRVQFPFSPMICCDISNMKSHVSSQLFIIVFLLVSSFFFFLNFPFAFFIDHSTNEKIVENVENL